MRMRNKAVSYRSTSYTMILPAYNEEARVRRVVEYYRSFAKILVIDNFSSDNTRCIVQELGVKLVQYKNPGTIQIPEWFRHVTSLIDTDYFLLLSCSEFIPVPLLDLFNEIAISRNYDVVSCVRDSYTCGELIPLWGGRFKHMEARIERFFNRSGLDYDGIVIHGSFLPTHKERLLQLPRDEKYVIAHLRDADAQYLIKKSIDYALVEAQHRAKKTIPITGIKLFSLFIKEILRFFHLPVSQWNRIALREVWARMVMHSVTYWIGWELRNNTGLDYSHHKSEDLWQKLVISQKS
jgi:glycosyltransferase involved in cell wall biosynthesis